MIVSLRVLLGLLVSLGIASNSLQAGLTYGQRYTPVADVELEDPGARINVTCHKEPGVRRKVLKRFFSDFCANYVHNQPGDVSNSEMEYALTEPWGRWKLKLTWSTKRLWAKRNCEVYYEALARRKACGTFRTKGGKVVVAKEAHGEEHSGPEKYSWYLTPPQEPEIQDEAEPWDQQQRTGSE